MFVKVVSWTRSLASACEVMKARMRERVLVGTYEKGLLAYTYKKGLVGERGLLALGWLFRVELELSREIVVSDKSRLSEVGDERK
ncbi:unnamed protein product [Dovyalis caffra]|uniref:Uncharacterized protein n=1 Tax=Dovyalis caffra TaxID=77055 RepID=A0AAV1SUA9_9ROSI|nr:unnamed protein product [Dovyalis caffra]